MDEVTSAAGIVAGVTEYRSEATCPLSPAVEDASLTLPVTTTVAAYEAPSEGLEMATWGAIASFLCRRRAWSMGLRQARSAEAESASPARISAREAFI
jgi:hypothetical protein